MLSNEAKTDKLHVDENYGRNTNFGILIDENKLTNDEISNLQSPDYCKRVFNTRYEVLRKSSRSRLDDLGRARYYSKEIAPKYWLSSQWYEHQRELFLNWMKSL